MNKDTQEMAFLSGRGIPIVYLARVDCQTVPLLQKNSLVSDFVIHSAISDSDELQVVMPVAEGAHFGVFGERIGFYIERDTSRVVMDDLGGVLHDVMFCLSHSTSSFVNSMRIDPVRKPAGQSCVDDTIFVVNGENCDRNLLLQILSCHYPAGKKNRKGTSI